MHRQTILFLLFPVLLFSQKKVGEVLAPQKLYADSIMCVQYGSEFFNRYFVFDQESGGYLEGRQEWNDFTEDDTAQYYYLWYFFRFPGAKPDSFSYAEFYGDSTAMPDRILYITSYPAECLNLDSMRLDSIARSNFNHPLKDCTVRLYEFNLFDDSLFFVLDSSHVFLELEYDYYRYYGLRKNKYKMRRTTIVIDGCSGSLISREYINVKGDKRWNHDIIPCAF